MVNRARFVGGLLCILASLIAVYGAGFSWRQVILASVAAIIAWVGISIFKAASPQRKFRRYQFRLSIDLGKAFEAAGVYGSELPELIQAIYDATPGRGSIYFTWMEEELYFINTESSFGSDAKFEIDIPLFGSRAPAKRFELGDKLEMRIAAEDKGYELVLLTRGELNAGHYWDKHKGLRLCLIPFKALWAFQSDDLNVRPHDDLIAAGFTYWSDEEVRAAWAYENEFVSLHWWPV